MMMQIYKIEIKNLAISERFFYLCTAIGKNDALSSDWERWV